MPCSRARLVVATCIGVFCAAACSSGPRGTCYAENDLSDALSGQFSVTVRGVASSFDLSGASFEENVIRSASGATTAPGIQQDWVGFHVYSATMGGYDAAIFIHFSGIPLGVSSPVDVQVFSCPSDHPYLSDPYATPSPMYCGVEPIIGAGGGPNMVAPTMDPVRGSTVVRKFAPERCSHAPSGNSAESRCGQTIVADVSVAPTEGAVFTGTLSINYDVELDPYRCNEDQTIDP